LAAVQKWIPSNGQLLDYGCGPGRLARLLAEAGYRVVAVDPSPKMIGEAKKQRPVPELEFATVSEGGRLESAAYDGIICSSVIEYVADPAALLQRFRLALRANGKLVLSYANRHSLWRAYAKWRFPESRHLPLQHHVWTFRECTQALADQRFEVIDGPLFFDSPFDLVRVLRSCARCGIVGTLGLVVCQVATRAD
jgi:SAM-dependent methyltransferase